jgi:hypothetical protein
MTRTKSEGTFALLVALGFLLVAITMSRSSAQVTTLNPSPNPPAQANVEQPVAGPPEVPIASPIINGLQTTMAGPAVANRKDMRTKKEIELASMIRDRLTEPAELLLESVPLGKIAEALSEKTELPILPDAHGMEYAKVDAAAPITFQSTNVPLRVALRQLLEPHGLQADVRDDSVVITADYAALSRRGTATSQWLNVPEATWVNIRRAMDQEVSMDVVDEPLDQVISQLSEALDVPIKIDGASMEELGLTVDVPVHAHMKDVTAHSLFSGLLRDHGLTFTIRHECLEVTSIDAAEVNPLSRIYWLDGLGVYNSDLDSLTQLIQTSIQPDTWEALGGPSTMAPIRFHQPNRCGMVISTTLSVHDEVSNLLENLRANNMGPDVFLDAQATPMSPKTTGMGGMGGGFGGGMGGQGGGGMF